MVTAKTINERWMSSNELLTKYFNSTFSYNLGQLSSYDGRQFRITAFSSLSKSLSLLKFKYEAGLECEFSLLELALDKINELGKRTDAGTNKELSLFIDYFKLKTIELLYTHEYMAGIADLISNCLYDWASANKKNITRSYCSNLAWAGLQKTNTFKEKVKKQELNKAEIGRNLESEQENYTNSKGQACAD